MPKKTASEIKSGNVEERLLIIYKSINNKQYRISLNIRLQTAKKTQKNINTPQVFLLINLNPTPGA